MFKTGDKVKAKIIKLGRAMRCRRGAEEQTAR
jgi:hypothetical protein